MELCQLTGEDQVPYFFNFNDRFWTSVQCPNLQKKKQKSFYSPLTMLTIRMKYKIDFFSVFLDPTLCVVHPLTSFGWYYWVRMSCDYSVLFGRILTRSFQVYPCSLLELGKALNYYSLPYGQDESNLLCHTSKIFCITWRVQGRNICSSWSNNRYRWWSKVLNLFRANSQVIMY